MSTIKQVGHTNGDKGISQIQNLKLGEVRYYPQDNPNIDMTSTKPVSPAAFLWIIHRLFPKYIVDWNNSSHKPEIASVGKIKNGTYMAVLINKGYVCVKEATKECDGRVLYLHDGVVIAYREKFTNNN